MKIRFSTLIFIFVLTSCSRVTEKHYTTTDATNGGFTNIRFDLNADNTLNLIKIDQKVISQNDSGTVYIPDTLSVPGTWKAINGNIRCEMKLSEEDISEAFFKSSFKTKEAFQNYNEVVFPETADTIFIYGQPCIATKTTNR